MAIYTGVADSNGDFNIPFSTNYTGGQKVTVTAEKDSATKSIEIYAPSEVAGGGSIQFSGNLENFPNNIGVVTLSQEFTSVEAYAFQAGANSNSMWRKATGLIMDDSIQSVGPYAFQFWAGATTLKLPSNLVSISDGAFASWTSLLKIDIPATVTTIGSFSFQLASAVTEIIVRNPTPPSIRAGTFQNVNATAVFKVPAASVATYQAAANWSTYAARIQAI